MEKEEVKIEPQRHKYEKISQKTPLKYDEIEKLGTLQCTVKEVAYFFGLAEETLYGDDIAMEYYYAGKEKGKISLRRKQFDLVDQGNCQMTIWLGKQYLGQKDKQEHSGDVKTSITVLPASRLTEKDGYEVIEPKPERLGVTDGK